MHSGTWKKNLHDLQVHGSDNRETQLWDHSRLHALDHTVRQACQLDSVFSILRAMDIGKHIGELATSTLTVWLGTIAFLTEVTLARRLDNRLVQAGASCMFSSLLQPIAARRPRA